MMREPERGTENTPKEKKEIDKEMERWTKNEGKIEIEKITMI